MSLYYHPDDALPQSPGLTPFKPKVTPSPSPPPAVTHPILLSPVTTRRLTSSFSRGRKKSNRPKTNPSPGDFVLINVMDPNRPDIARDAGARALNSDSGSDDDDFDSPSPTAEPMPLPTPHHPSRLAAIPGISSLNLSDIAQEALNANPASQKDVFKTPFRPGHRDSVVELDTQDHNAVSTETSTSDPSFVAPVDNGVPSRAAETRSPTLSAERHGSFSNGQPHIQAPLISSNLHELVIPARRGSDIPTRLPALQTPQSPPSEASATSPGQKQQLPSFRHLSDLAETAEQEMNRTQLPHRQSISSIGQSPTSVSRQLSITSLSPASGYPLSASSPGGNSDIQTRDPFLRTGQQLSFLSTRRPSQASDVGPFSATLHSTTTNDSYQSSEGLSPGSQGPRLSIDSAMTSRTLPPPVGPNIQHVPSHGSGGFKCDYPGCNATPFQTQYLLNSHANVHSQTRTHFCPVRDCPRSEGGKGFKRKNEMIRHGLVHASPGYVCPFCPDREHKYPRPDNLQRHVRVHHPEKDKDDAQLREVLAQRPEGGSRGRRRRVS
ncbi:unnamed protein product [Periconia digitata]|uniref:C2H2-type domain-containing protein n=1 Tax=Periconia digitata TaxID=1303443 RepID=A0A9W4XWI5_9PLEO|nr:unnamed protein product [Periconia digitata]